MDLLPVTWWLIQWLTYDGQRLIIHISYYNLDKFDFLKHRLQVKQASKPDVRPRPVTSQPFNVKRRLNSYNSLKRNRRQFIYILDQIKRLGVAEVSRLFKIPKSTLYSWRQKTLQFGRLRQHGGGRKPLLTEAEEIQLCSWILARRDRKLSVTPQNVKDKAKLIHPNFAASDKWLHGFFRRHNLSLRTPTVSTSKLYSREALAEELDKFWTSINTNRQNHCIPVNFIGNMDEVAIYYEVPARKVVQKRGSKTVVVKTSGASRSRVTGILAVMADGTKLPPMIIFKGKTTACVKGVVVSPKVAHIAFQENAWNDHSLTRLWFDKVWHHHVGTNVNLLVWDEFGGHKKFQASKQRQFANTHIVLIPPACTPIVQPLDVSINKSFKHHYRAMHDRWRANQTVFQSPTKQLVVNWIVSAWNRVPAEIVAKSFKVCGISNDLNGSEEHLVSVKFHRMLNE